MPRKRNKSKISTTRGYSGSDGKIDTRPSMAGEQGRCAALPASRTRWFGEPRLELLLTNKSKAAAVATPRARNRAESPGIRALLSHPTIYVHSCNASLVRSKHSMSNNKIDG